VRAAAVREEAHARTHSNAATGRLSPPRVFPLEEAIVYVAPDEQLVEVTPSRLRLRKRLLDPNERDKLSRSLAKTMRAENK